MKPNMEFLITLLNTTRFYLTLMASTLIFLWRQKRRPWSPLFIIVIPILGTLEMSLVNYYLPNSNLKNLIVFGGTMLVTLIMAITCFEVHWEEGAFCMVAGYSVQFIASLCGEMVFHLFFLSPAEHFLWQIPITAAVVPMAYFCFGRQLKRGQNMDLNRRALLLLAVSAVVAEVALCYNLRLRWLIAKDHMHMVCDAALLVLCSIFILVILFGLLVQHNLEDELKIIYQLRRKAQDQYQIASETIDQINQKCHDMRHQIRTIGQSARVTSDALADMERAIDIYDSMIQTGCRALDIILTEKSLYCQKNSIVIRCIADGSGLRMIRDVDIYSLFGNLLDNAIHAVQELEIERRVINLTVKVYGELLSINSYNCYDGEMIMEEGLPVTSGDPRYHGFGTKSMVSIVNKYGGTVSFQAKDGVFNVNMLFPFINPEKDTDAFCIEQ